MAQDVACPQALPPQADSCPGPSAAGGGTAWIYWARGGGTGVKNYLSASPTAGVLHRPEQCGEIILNPGLVLTVSRSGGQSVKNSSK